MITIKNFVGAMLEEVTRARVLSDAASARIADQYLNHEILKGFPVPRMHIRDIQLELNFAVSPVQNGGSKLESEEVQKNIVHRMHDLVYGFSEHPDFTGFFEKDDKLKLAWKEGLNQLPARFARVLVQPAAGVTDVTKNLSIIVENYFYELAPGNVRSNLSKLLDHPMRMHKLKEGDSMRASISNQVSALIAVATNVHPTSSSDPLDITVLVGAAELEKINPDQLHKLKITLDSSDRKWVTIEKDGEKTYILDKD